ncbi:ParB N-terminal domain-containing protein [Pseudoroseomonas cervicalis]|uniref:ParB N-terminal domain-containing protein n=1 Tax=Teichococcus cervicalis TaxID=204525 RepID=UPI0022F1B2EE|nr:ParB N-terminal domain-containing protein [Pseudoroseomonas cervicalis]WBV42758.1 ParB N-terminal domain-containing protein [Pseudoroseomonas cervicalis]
MGDVIPTPRQVDIEADMAPPRALLAPIGEVAAAGDNLRRHRAPDRDRQLRDSIAAMGILQPLLVRPRAEGGWVVIEGHGRLQAAQELGLAQVPIVVRPSGEAEQLAVQAATNIVRAPLERIDQWRAIVSLQERGYSLVEAAGAIGIAERRARQLDRLGRLHPALLAEIEKHGMPADHVLTRVASAPPEAQAAALKGAGVWQGSGKARQLVWHKLSAALSSERIPRSRAIFDPAEAGIAVEEDLFAEPGSREQFFFTDVRSFLAAQEQALAKLAAAKPKPRIEIVAWKEQGPAIPRGWIRLYGDKKPKGCVSYRAIAPSGWNIGEVVEVLALPPAPPKKKEGQPGAVASTEAEEAEAPPVPQRERLTKRGRDILAQMQTDGLHAALRQDAEQRDEAEWLELLLVALCADNVQIYPGGTERYRPAVRFDDIAAQLLDEQAQQRELEHGVTRRLAAEALCRILSVKGPTRSGSGDAAHWVGRWVDARGSMPFLDTPELLATLSADTLRHIAADLDMPTGGTAAALRERLAGKARAMWLEEAEFAAPGPQPPEPESDAEGEEE